MPIQLLAKTSAWKKSDLAKRITLLSAVLALATFVPVLVLAYVAMHSLVTSKTDSELLLAATEAQARFETGLDALIGKVRSTAAQSIFSNALADSSERSKYVEPLLKEFCSSHPAVTTLVLTDFRGQVLNSGCQGYLFDAAVAAAEAKAAVTAGKPVSSARATSGAPNLSLAAPVFYLPTKSFEGALWVDIDLNVLFEELMPPVLSPYRFDLTLQASDGRGRDTLEPANSLTKVLPIKALLPSVPTIGLKASIEPGVAFAPLNNLVAGFLLIGLFISAFIVWQSRRIAARLARPLNELEQTASRVATGDFENIPIVELHKDDHDNFRKLSAHVYDMIRTLRDTQQQLSSTLALRTSQMERAEADRRLKEHALASSTSGVLILEADEAQTTRVRYANPAFLEMLGKSESELLHARWPQLLENPRIQLAPQTTASAADDTAPKTLMIKRPDGKPRYLELSLSPVVEDDLQNGSHTIAILNDVTEHHEANLALALRDRAMQSASNGIVITDLQQHDNPIIYVNPAFEAITQYSLQEVIGHNCRLLRSPDADENSLAILREAINARQACRVTLRNRRKDGSEFWNQLSISPVANPVTGEYTHYVGIQTDITATKINEEMLLEWLSRLDVIFTLSPDPLVCFDDKGQLSYANTAAERIFGTTMGALMARTIEDFSAQVRAQCDPTQAYFGLPAVSETSADIKSGQTDPAQDCLIHLIHPKPLTLHQTYRYCGSKGTSLVVYYRDVTREAELDRMKSEFLSTAAHELRTPMASIIGFSELLMMRRYDEAKTRELLGTINAQANRLTLLLSDLLDLARIEARRAEVFNFEALSALAMLDDAIAAFMVPDEQYRLIVNRPAEALPEIRADRTKFQQALFNVLSNALKFSPKGSDIEVSVIARHPEARPLIGISVRDHGIGMNEEARRRAFERFYRSDRSGHIPGTGLGLALVKEIMTVHGGEVTLESEPDVGTCITLWFPLATADRTPQAISSPSRIEATSK